MNNGVNNFTLAEEIWHSITHGVGLLLSIVGLTVLVAYAAISDSQIAIISSAIYGASLIIMYGSSTLYHAITEPNVKSLFNTFDHSAIYFLIAGSYTPVTLLILHSTLGYAILAFNWTLALIGISLKFIYPNRFENLSLFFYLLMGWAIVVDYDDLIANMEINGIYLMIAGGLSYTLGVLFYVKDHKPYFHAYWHLFVLAGSIFHYFMTLLFVI